MTLKKRILVACLSVFMGVTVYLLLFGKLFPFSPVIIGFEKHECSKTVIFTQTGLSNFDYSNIDSLIPGVEEFHKLTFLNKPEIFLFADSLSYIRHSLSKARLCAFYNGRVFVTPWAIREAQNGQISLRIYLTHELSHSLLHQHSGVIHSAFYPKWLLEGIAMYSSGQMGTTFYPGKEDTYKLIRNGNFMPPEYFKTRKEDKIRLDVNMRIPFMYSEFGCIVSYLIEHYGREKFLIYMKSLIKDGNNKEIFKNIYGADFENVLYDFRKSATQSSQ